MSAKWIITGLVALNALLGAAIVVRTGGLGNTAHAQMGRAKVDFVIVPGNTNGNLAVLYVLDANTGQLAVLQPDPVAKQVVVLSRVDVSKDLK